MSEDFKTTQKIISPSPDGAAAADGASLVVIRGEPFGKSFSLGHKPVSMGRSSSCDIQFGEDSVSRLQCQIWENEQGYWIADSESTNPTLLNGDPVAKARLRDGDRIAFGPVILKFVASDSVEAAYHSDMYNRAIHDPLTGILNRRAFDEALSQSVRTSARDGNALSLGIFDIDHFKQINDNHDHLTGDAVLCALTRRLQALCPQSATLARLGGEEFGLLLPGLALTDAAQILEKAREAVAEKSLIDEPEPIAITVSVGAAQLLPRMRNPAALVKAADRALLAAKQQGRNRLVLAEA